MVDIPLRCLCGRMRGVARAVSPSAGFRFVCYCKDCQAFARFLEQPSTCSAIAKASYFDAEIANSAFDLAVSKKQLHGSQIACTAVDQRRLRSAK